MSFEYRRDVLAITESPMAITRLPSTRAPTWASGAIGRVVRMVVLAVGSPASAVGSRVDGSPPTGTVPGVTGPLLEAEPPHAVAAATAARRRNTRRTTIWLPIRPGRPR